MIVVMLTTKELADLAVAMQSQPSVDVTASSEAISRAIRDMQLKYEASKQHSPRPETSDSPADTHQ